ncbi:tRNA-modifying protein YgfZ [Candidatus Profftia tarda]|nr:tRNA-modifying protein YgfZ [Candidatus Profftia tarda]
MPFHYPFEEKKLVTANQLPPTIMLLNDWQVVSVTGDDAIKYLQGQLTADLTSLVEEKHILSGHCNPRGKMWCTLRVFHSSEGLSYLINQSVANQQIKALKKYAVFSNVTIAPKDNVIIFGVAGFKVADQLKSFFTQLPDAKKPAITHQETTLLYLKHPEERYILITSQLNAGIIIENLKKKVELNDSKQWMSLDIEAGYPIFYTVNSEKFLPQATNLQLLNAICFNKGCYSGQEIIARAQYRGANKQALYWLQGSASRLPLPGEEVELYLNTRWRHIGTTLAAIQLTNGSLNIQAILHKDIEKDSILRVFDDERSVLKIKDLTY